MNNKKIHERKCIGCGQMKDKAVLIRIVKNNDSGIFLDETGKSNGRGAYLCKDMECLKSAESKKALERSFKCKISPETYKAIYEEFNKIET